MTSLNFKCSLLIKKNHILKKNKVNDTSHCFIPQQLVTRERPKTGGGGTSI